MNAPLKKVNIQKKRKNLRKIPVGAVHVLASFNNTIVTVTDLAGNALTWSSSGKAGFKGSKRGTPYAAQVAATQAVDEAKKTYEVKTVGVYVNGPGAGRESAIRALRTSGMIVTFINDITSTPHNGCRPPKKRKV